MSTSLEDGDPGSKVEGNSVTTGARCGADSGNWDEEDRRESDTPGRDPVWEREVPGELSRMAQWSTPMDEQRQRSDRERRTAAEEAVRRCSTEVQAGSQPTGREELDRRDSGLGATNRRRSEITDDDPSLITWWSEVPGQRIVP